MADCPARWLRVSPAASSGAQEVTGRRDFLPLPLPHVRTRSTNARAVPSSPRPPIADGVAHQCRNINRPAIAYGICPRLRTDLPQEDEPSLRTLRLSADGILTRLLATYTGILTSVESTRPSGHASLPTERSPTIPGLSPRDPSLRYPA